MSIKYYGQKCLLDYPVIISTRLDFTQWEGKWH